MTDEQIPQPEPPLHKHADWIAWNMGTYGNDFETAKRLLAQRLWALTF